MNRRKALQMLGVLSIDASLRKRGQLSWNQNVKPDPASTQLAAESWPSVVAGVRLVDSTIAKIATGLSLTVSPPYLFNHAGLSFVVHCWDEP